MIQISINNNDSSDLFVTVFDNNVNPPAPVITSQRMNHDGQVLPIQVQEDGDGKGNISWAAVKADDQDTSKEGTATPENMDTVDVSTF